MSDFLYNLAQSIKHNYEMKCQLTLLHDQLDYLHPVGVSCLQIADVGYYQLRHANVESLHPILS